MTEADLKRAMRRVRRKLEELEHRYHVDNVLTGDWMFKGSLKEFFKNYVKRQNDPQTLLLTRIQDDEEFDEDDEGDIAQQRRIRRRERIGDKADLEDLRITLLYCVHKFTNAQRLALLLLSNDAVKWLDEVSVSGGFLEGTTRNRRFMEGLSELFKKFIPDAVVRGLSQELLWRSDTVAPYDSSVKDLVVRIFTRQQPAQPSEHGEYFELQNLLLKGFPSVHRVTFDLQHDIQFLLLPKEFTESLELRKVMDPVSGTYIRATPRVLIDLIAPRVDRMSSRLRRQLATNAQAAQKHLRAYIARVTGLRDTPVSKFVFGEQLLQVLENIERYALLHADAERESSFVDDWIMKPLFTRFFDEGGRRTGGRSRHPSRYKK